MASARMFVACLLRDRGCNDHDPPSFTGTARTRTLQSGRLAGHKVNCGPGGPAEYRASCDSAEEALPYGLVGTGVGAVVSGIGIGLFVGNVNPSVEVLPAIGKRARRAPETFVGIGSVRGSTLPGLTLQASF
jgi:hypothetical protein